MQQLAVYLTPQVFLVLMAALALLDCWSTVYCLRHHLAEGNPIMRWLMSNLGRDGGLAMSKILTLGWTFTHGPYPLNSMLILLGLYILVVGHNLYLVAQIRSKLS